MRGLIGTFMVESWAGVQGKWAMGIFVMAENRAQSGAAQDGFGFVQLKLARTPLWFPFNASA